MAIAANIGFPHVTYGAESDSIHTQSAESKNNFVLTGVHTEGFHLTSNNNKIFDVDGCLPGDKIEAVIEAENTTDETLDLALVSIDSLMHDTSLFDALELSIEYEGDVLYEGAFQTDTSFVTDYISVDAGERIALDISVEVPKELDNKYQGTEMESAWVFEAKHPGHEFAGHDTSTNDGINPDQSVGDKGNQNGVKTGVELPGCGVNTRIFIVLGVIFIALGLFLIFKSKKKKTE